MRGHLLGRVVRRLEHTGRTLLTGRSHPPDQPPPATDDYSAIRAQVEGLVSEARYIDARDALWSAYDKRSVADPYIEELLGKLEFSTGRYDAAEALFRLAGNDARLSAGAASALSDLAWVRRRFDDSAEYARVALRHNPEDRIAKIRLLRAESARGEKAPAGEDAVRRLSHVAFFVSGEGNFGDVVLPEAVRHAFQSIEGPVSWRPVHAHHVFDEELLERVNATEGVVIGGGGLILPDTAPNGNSGWQWNVPTEMIRRIEVPIGLHGVGFNLFRGQEIPHPRFLENFTALAERAEVLGFRNSGSVDKVRALLPQRLSDKVRLSPCPTTVLSRIADLPERSRNDVPTVALNMAYDRQERRFGSSYLSFLSKMARVVAGMRARGWKVVYAAHLPEDEKFVTDLGEAHGVPLEVVRLYSSGITAALETYGSMDLVIGMRGHATMIPFGLGVPVLSIVSHDKMWYFLDDIGRREWGVEVGDPRLDDLLLEAADDIIARVAEYEADIEQLKDPLEQLVRDRAEDLLRAVR